MIRLHSRIAFAIGPMAGLCESMGVRTFICPQCDLTHIRLCATADGKTQDHDGPWIELKVDPRTAELIAQALVSPDVPAPSQPVDPDRPF